MQIIFADLTHNGHTCNSVPYGIALVAAYALETIGREITALLVTKPTELASVLEEHEPGIVCFSTYVWNVEIALAFAVRIKKKYPNCITVFGGPHYPTAVVAQQAYLQSHPEIDFYVYREGESGFVKLYHALREFCFDAAQLKKQVVPVAGCHYCQGDVLVAGPALTPIDPLDLLPSPYLSGLCDELLAEGHSPVIQTVRGCPFRCTYCQEGDDYFNTIRRYSTARIKSELLHIASLTTVPTLFLADSNFGMYPDDMGIAEELASVQKKMGWPEFVNCISGKNNKEQVLKTAATIQGGMLSAAIQSSDPVVLDNINRRNVSIKDLIELATEQDLNSMHSFSELIVALPGDTLHSHCKSAADLIDAGIHVVRSHQLIMLPGAEVASVESRRKFGLQTRFRVIHNTVNFYSLFGQTFHAPEVDEICVASDTMPFEDYLACRCFDLTLEIFYNNGVFAELHSFLKLQGVAISSFIMHLNNRVWDDPLLTTLYSGFLEDTRELWKTRAELGEFLRQPGVLERYETGELGRNEQLAYKGFALFERMDTLISLAYGVAADFLLQAGRLAPRVADYLDQLMSFDLQRKQGMMVVDEELICHFHYDFCRLSVSEFNSLPWEHRLNEEVSLHFCHSEKHRRFVAEKADLLRAGLHGYATIISTNPKIREYFREVSPSGNNLLMDRIQNV